MFILFISILTIIDRNCLYGLDLRSLCVPVRVCVPAHVCVFVRMCAVTIFCLCFMAFCDCANRYLSIFCMWFMVGVVVPVLPLIISCNIVEIILISSRHTHVHTHTRMHAHWHYYCADAMVKFLIKILLKSCMIWSAVSTILCSLLQHLILLYEVLF